jgi:hypothetical protein
MKQLEDSDVKVLHNRNIRQSISYFYVHSSYLRCSFILVIDSLLVCFVILKAMENKTSHFNFLIFKYNKWIS